MGGAQAAHAPASEGKAEEWRTPSRILEATARATETEAARGKTRVTREASWWGGTG